MLLKSDSVDTFKLAFQCKRNLIQSSPEVIRTVSAPDYPFFPHTQCFARIRSRLIRKRGDFYSYEQLDVRTTRLTSIFDRICPTSCPFPLKRCRVFRRLSSLHGLRAASALG